METVLAVLALLVVGLLVLAGASGSGNCSVRLADRASPSSHRWPTGCTR
jgi:hypothetical protein